MAKSSFKTQVPTSHSRAHMSRQAPPKYLIVHDSDVNDYKSYMSEIEKENYIEKCKTICKEKTGRSMQKSAIESFYHEAVINCTKDTKLEDIEQLFKNLNKEFGGGFKPTQIAIHKDEGCFIQSPHKIDDLVHDSKNYKWYKNGEDVSDDVIAHMPNESIYYDKTSKNWYFDDKFTQKANVEDMQIHYNYHSHVEYSRFNENTGKARFTKKDMQKIQDITAETLGMERGQGKYESKRESLSHRQLKDKYSKINEEKIQKQKIKKELEDTKKENAYLKKQIEDLTRLSKRKFNIKKGFDIEDDNIDFSNLFIASQVAKLKEQFNIRNAQYNELLSKYTNLKKTNKSNIKTSKSNIKILNSYIKNLKKEMTQKQAYSQADYMKVNRIKEQLEKELKDKEFEVQELKLKLTKKLADSNIDFNIKNNFSNIKNEGQKKSSLLDEIEELKNKKPILGNNQEDYEEISPLNNENFEDNSNIRSTRNSRRRR